MYRHSNRKACDFESVREKSTKIDRTVVKQTEFHPATYLLLQTIYLVKFGNDI